MSDRLQEIEEQLIRSVCFKGNLIGITRDDVAWLIADNKRLRQEMEKHFAFEKEAEMWNRIARDAGV